MWPGSVGVPDTVEITARPRLLIRKKFSQWHLTSGFVTALSWLQQQRVMFLWKHPAVCACMWLRLMECDAWYHGCSSASYCYCHLWLQKIFPDTSRSHTPSAKFSSVAGIGLKALCQKMPRKLTISCITLNNWNIINNTRGKDTQT